MRVPIQERAKRTQSRIIEASASVLERRGYAATSLDEIAVELDMSRGALYHHFPSKALLAEAVVASHYERWQVLTDRVQARDLRPLSRIITLTYEVARISQIDPVVRAGLRLQLEHELVEKDLKKLLTKPYVGWIEYLSEIVVEGQISGEIISGVNPGELAANLVETYFGIQHVSFRLCDGEDLLMRINRWWGILLPAIATPHWLTANPDMLAAAKA